MNPKICDGCGQEALSLMNGVCCECWYIRHADAQAARDADRAEIAQLNATLDKYVADDVRYLATLEGKNSEIARLREALDEARNRSSANLRSLLDVSDALGLPADATAEAMVERAKRLTAFAESVRASKWCAVDRGVASALAALDGGTHG